VKRRCKLWIGIVSFFLFLSDEIGSLPKQNKKEGWGKLGGTSSNEKGFSPNMDVTSYSCFVHHMHAKKEEGLLI
jgi:hypothetical protein